MLQKVFNYRCYHVYYRFLASKYIIWAKNRYFVLAPPSPGEKLPAPPSLGAKFWKLAWGKLKLVHRSASIYRVTIYIWVP